MSSQLHEWDIHIVRFGTDGAGVTGVPPDRAVGVFYAIYACFSSNACAASPVVMVGHPPLVMAGVDPGLDPDAFVTSLRASAHKKTPRLRGFLE